MRSRSTALATAGLGAILCASLGAGLVAGCESGSDDSDGTVRLTFWSWAPNIDRVVERWNAKNPDVRVTFSKQGGGEEMLTKLLTAAKAKHAPDLVQAEYQALPTLISNDVVVDIAEQARGAEAAFAPAVWRQVTLGTKAVYGIPQDTGPMMLYYRSDLFAQYGLTVPTTWAQFADTARQLRAKDPTRYLTTFSTADPGWFAGLAQQAGASWWSVRGDAWRVTVADAATRKVAEYWGDLVGSGAVDDQPMYTPEWNTALNDGTLLAWPSAVWAPGVLTGNVPDTKGKWTMAALPQWNAGENTTGSWGGSSTAVTRDCRHKQAAARFARWLNTDPDATAGLVREAGIYPASRAAQTGPALAQPPAFFSQQRDFYQKARQIADTTAGFTWGPNVNVTYSAYKDAFGKAVSGRTPFGSALDQIQQVTVADLRKSGFKLDQG